MIQSIDIALKVYSTSRAILHFRFHEKMLKRALNYYSDWKVMYVRWLISFATCIRNEFQTGFFYCCRNTHYQSRYLFTYGSVLVFMSELLLSNWLLYWNCRLYRSFDKNEVSSRSYRLRILHFKCILICNELKDTHFNCKVNGLL